MIFSIFTFNTILHTICLESSHVNFNIRERQGVKEQSASKKINFKKLRKIEKLFIK